MSQNQTRGIFSIDPGGSTGVAWGVFNLEEKLVKDAMRNRRVSGSQTITGNEEIQLAQLVTLWDDFVYKCDRLDIAYDLVIEDFSLLPKSHKPGKEGISPVRYAWYFVGFIHGRDMPIAQDVCWQLPGVGLRYNTKQMLDNWGCWVKGREHERAAWAHVGARLMRLYQGHR